MLLVATAPVGAWSPTRRRLAAWQGYLLGPLGLGGESGSSAFASLGVLFGLVVGFAATLALNPVHVRAQEALAPADPARPR